MTTQTALTRARRCRHDDERGVVLVLVALLMVAMLVMVAIVIDLGQLRSDKRSDQAVADLASLAAGFYMSGRGSATAVSNPRAGCQAAVTSAQTNQPAFTASNSPCDFFPTDAATGCVNAPSTADPPGTAPHDAVMTAGGFTLTVRYPIPDSEITDQPGQRYSFTANDGIDPANPGGNPHQCERMKVTFASSSAASFARVIGVSTLDTLASAVLKAGTSQTQSGVAALLLLERVGCGTLQNSGQGAVWIQSSSNTNPGVIQADSAGIVNAAAPVTCGNNDNGNAPNWTVYGPALPGNNGPSILVQAATNGQPGIIGVYSLNVAGRGGAVYPGGLSVAPVGSGIASRAFADEKYNQPLADGGNAQISQLHADGYTRAHMGWGNNSTDGAQGQQFTLRIGPSPAECNGYNGAPLDAKIFVDCTDFQPDLAIFPNATDVVFTGRLTVNSNKVLSLPAAQRVTVAGDTGSYAVQVKSGGTLLVNTGETSIPSPANSGVSCAQLPGRGVEVTPGNYGTNWNTTTFATFGGDFESPSGFVRMCQTFVYLGDNNPTYDLSRYTITTSQVPSPAPESYPALAVCSAAQPCPKNVTNNSAINITGGNNVGVDWSAPNQLHLDADGKPPPPSAYAYPNGQPFEDLALWTEVGVNQPSGGNIIQNAIKGQGSNSTTGVYFIPNGSAVFTGQASQQQPLNAQFIIRMLDIHGQGTLTLKPNPADAIVTPIPGAIQIIR